MDELGQSLFDRDLRRRPEGAYRADESGLALGWKVGAGRHDIWHDETGFARSIPITLGAALSRRLERLFFREIRLETQRLERRSKRKSKPKPRKAKKAR
jgi:hypothetical protein